MLIETVHLFPLLDQQLISLLRSLEPADWNKPTVAKLWTVKDVAAHLLDGNIRTISMSRDKYFGESPGNINSNEELVGFLNKLNADWVKAMKRVSPALLIELLEQTGKQYNEHVRSMNPYGKALFPVAWAGETESLNWFHIAREYTEKWHHQQQIREAVNKPGIMTKELYHPFLQTFMMALPHTYRNVQASEGQTVRITISGAGGGEWYLVMRNKWELREAAPNADAHVTIDGNIAWKLFSKSWRRKEAEHYISIKGDAALADPVLDMVSVMA